MGSKLAVVTGGSSGIGKDIAVELSKAGWDVAVTYNGDREGGNDCVRLIEENGQLGAAFKCDVGSAEQVTDFFNNIDQSFVSTPTLLVNNAGIQTWCSLLDLDEKDWDRVLKTNLKGTFMCTQAVAKRMIKGKVKGSIVNIGSGCNKFPFPNLVDYSASKGGMEMFTRSSAVELGPHGIRVNCVAPGGILIERTKREAPDYAKQWGGIAPLGRVGYPVDIFNAVEFFAGDKSDFITGQTLWVDGGVFTVPNWPYQHDHSVNEE
jgi:NAD(P)-dependent dehydrogenase (short-subunit alcohol dehydrogenase family)